MIRVIRTAHLSYDSRSGCVYRTPFYQAARTKEFVMPSGFPIAPLFAMPQLSPELMEEWDTIADMIFCEYCEQQMLKDDD